MDIMNVSFKRDSFGYSYISAEIDGKLAKIPAEQKSLQYDIVFVGADFEDILPDVTLPADPPNGRPIPTTLRGCVQDTQLTAIVRQFLQETNSGNFKPHKVTLPKG